MIFGMKIMHAITTLIMDAHNTAAALTSLINFLRCVIDFFILKLVWSRSFLTFV